MSASAAAPYEMKSDTCSCDASRYSSIGFSWPRNGCSFASSGSAPSSVSRAAGRPVFDASITGSRLRKNASRSGASARTSASVGLRSCATGRRSCTSGRVSVENSCRRASVAFDSSRNVGKMRIDSASASLRDAVASNTRLDDVISVRSCCSFSVSAANVTPVFLTSRWSAPLLRVEHPQHVGPVGGEPGQRAERVVEVAPAARDALRQLLLPGAERRARGGVERVEDLVELHGVGDLRVRQPLALSGSVRAACPGVSSTYVSPSSVFWRSIACASACSGANSRSSSIVATRAVAVAVDLELAHLADRDARDPDVRLRRERGRLRERDLHPVALRLERDRAAERQPQEQQQAEARQREHGHREDPRE